MILLNNFICVYLDSFQYNALIIENFVSNKYFLIKSISQWTIEWYFVNKFILGFFGRLMFRIDYRIN